MYKQQSDYNNNMFRCRIVGIDDLEFDRLNQGLEKPLDKEALTDFPAYYSAGYNPDLIISDDYFEKLV